MTIRVCNLIRHGHIENVIEDSRPFDSQSSKLLQRLAKPSDVPSRVATGPRSSIGGSSLSRRHPDRNVSEPQGRRYTFPEFRSQSRLETSQLSPRLPSLTRSSRNRRSALSPHTDSPRPPVERR